MAKVLTGARLVDGTGAPAVEGQSVRVEGDQIVAVGSDVAGADDEVLDLSGLVLAPGFIDVHTHFDAQVFWDGGLTPSPWHGVTTAIQGNCGFGIAPTRPEHRDTIIETLENVEGMNADTLAAGIRWDFETFPEYLAAIDRAPKRINLGTYVGHTPMRTWVMGEQATEREATEPEVQAMVRIVEEAMAAGAVGVSTSFADSHIGARGRPVPSRLAGREEFLALLRAMKTSGRGVAEITYGPPFTIEEAARISRDLGVRITWGALLTQLFGGHGKTLEMLDRASAEGGDLWPQTSCREIVFQMTLQDPYYFGRVPAFQRVLAVARDERPAVYADRGWRDEARPQIEGVRPAWFHKMSVQETTLFPELVGRTLAEVGQERGVHPFDLLLDLSLEEGLATRLRVVSLNDDAEELAALLRDDRVLLGAHDAGAHVSMLCDANFPTHLLSHWVRDRGVLELEQAVWRLAGQPAEVYGLSDRGRIAPGRLADLVAFDDNTVASKPIERRFDFPAGGDRLVADSIGIEHVWVNGVATRRDGVEVDGVAPGRLVS